MSAASGISTRTCIPSWTSRSTTYRALRSDSFRPVCATTSAVRLPPATFAAPIVNKCPSYPASSVSLRALGDRPPQVLIVQR